MIKEKYLLDANVFVTPYQNIAGVIGDGRGVFFIPNLMQGSLVPF